MNDKNTILCPQLSKEKKNEWDDSHILADDTFSLDDSRPVYAQAWAEDGYTFLTYYISKEGLEERTLKSLIEYLELQGVTINSKIKHTASMMSIHDENGMNCWSITLTVGESSE